jgi:hypothetical protein
MGNGQWAMGNGQWAMGNGQWAMGNGQWEFLLLLDTEGNYEIATQVNDESFCQSIAHIDTLCYNTFRGERADRICTI